MIELRRVRCTKCGAEFNDDYDPTASVLRCKRLGCGATFVVHQAQDLAAKHPDREIDILNLRMLLDEAVNANDTELMIQRAQEIRSYVPDDAFASYIESLGQKMRKQYKLYQQFLAAAGDMTSEDAQRILTIALNREHFSDHDREAVIMFIDNHLDNEHKALWRMRLDNAVKRLFEDQERYSVIPRDVFICHSSADAIALEIYRALTDDGVKCWISEENLPPKTEYYWPKIEEAIRNCKIILVVCSQSAMLRDDPMKEMLYAESQNLKKLEFKIDDKPHTTFFRHYFNGIQWIEFDKNISNNSFNDLKTRVYRLLHATQEQEQSPKFDPKPETEPKRESILNPNLEPIVLPNAKAEQALRSAAGLNKSELITMSTLAMLEKIELGACDLEDISFLKYASSLKILDLTYNRISDISSLSTLVSLEHLNLVGNQIYDITPLNKLRALSVLYLDNNQIKNITPLKTLNTLLDLSLSHNQISDLSGLSSLISLQRLYLHSNKIDNLSSLSGLIALKSLSLNNNQIVNISPIQWLKSLEFLSLNKNRIKDLIPLAELKKLNILRIADNFITDYSPLSNLGSLNNMDVPRPDTRTIPSSPR